jgi:hypothetical protein
MSLYIPFIHKIVKKEKKPQQIPLHIEKDPKILEKKDKEEKDTIITIELF